MIQWLGASTTFPPLDHALASPNGLLAAGGDLSPARLLAAYHRGIFPWYSEGQPILWWSPDPRMVLYVSEFRISQSLRKTIRRRPFRIETDTCFDDVTLQCATVDRDGQSGTWITPEMRAAYSKLHALGVAHSVEVWRDERLVGGLYGLLIGKVFFGESMFARESDASKVALVALLLELSRRDVRLVDCQQETAHLASFGARPVPRRQFASELEALIHSKDVVTPWSKGSIEVYA